MTVRILFNLGIVILFSNTITAQTNKCFIDTSTKIIVDHKSVYIGFTDGREDGTVAPDSVIKTVKISKTTFLALSKNQYQTIRYDSSTIIRNKKSVTIKNGYIKKTYRNDDEQSTECIGLIDSLNLYIVRIVVPSQEIATVDFVDYRTGKTYEVQSCADEGVQDMLISPKQSALLVYSNTDFEAGSCCIDIYKIRKNASRSKYTMKAGLFLNFNKVNIQKLVWVTEKSFVMEITERDQVENNNNYDWGKKKKYYMKINLLK
jgi:hypothetical protein